MIDKTRSDRGIAPENILIVGPSWVSDIVLSHSLLQLLVEQSHAARGGCMIDVLAPGWSSALYRRMPEVRNVINMPLGHGKIGLGLRRQLGQSLRKESYDRAIVLPNSFKSAIVPFSAQIPIRTGWRGEMRYALLNDLRVLKESNYSKLIERFVALSLPCGEALPESIPCPRLLHCPDEVNATRTKFNLQARNSPIVAICPRTCGGETDPVIEGFSAERYGKLAAMILAEGIDVWLFGTREQKAFAKAVLHSATQELMSITNQGSSKSGSVGEIVNMTGLTTLNEVLDLLTLVGGVVTDDRGIKLASVALNVPTVSISISKEEEQLFALPNASDNLISIDGESLNPLFSNVLNVVSCSGHSEREEKPISAAIV